MNWLRRLLQIYIEKLNWRVRSGLSSDDWKEVVFILLAWSVSMLASWYLSIDAFKSLDRKSVLGNMLTVNGVFAAILITYLFSKMPWLLDRKLELRNEAISLSQKILEFRRILDRLTIYYNVWNNDKQTKSLIDFGEFKHIDYYDFIMYSMSDYVPDDAELIKKLHKHKNFNEGKTSLYLAMVSLVKDRKQGVVMHEELYKDFNFEGWHTLYHVDRWLTCQIFYSISTGLNKNDWINYNALPGKDRSYISSAAARFHNKYEGHDINNTLIVEMADDIGSHYLPELQKRLMSMKKGIDGLNLLIMIMILVSMVSGVLIPFLLLIINSSEDWSSFATAWFASINIGLIAYFIVKFPFLINKELRWE